MEHIEYNICNSEGKSNCVIRSFCKLYNKDYDTIYRELCNIKKELNSNSYNDIEVFELYMNRNNTYSIDYDKDIKIKDLVLDNGEYIVFCWNKEEYYHMIPIIDNTVYDKNSESLDLYVINIYKKVNKKSS